MHLITGIWCLLSSAPICSLLQIRSSAQLQIFVHMKCLTGPLPNCMHFTCFSSDMDLKLPTTAWEQQKLKGKGRNVSNKSLPPLHSLSDSKHSSFEGFQLSLYENIFQSGDKRMNIKRGGKDCGTTGLHSNLQPWLWRGKRWQLWSYICVRAKFPTRVLISITVWGAW